MLQWFKTTKTRNSTRLTLLWHGLPDGLPQLDLRFFLRVDQIEALKSSVSGKDAIAVLPTGYEKASKYQLAPLVVKQMCQYISDFHIYVTQTPKYSPAFTTRSRIPLVYVSLPDTAPLARHCRSEHVNWKIKSQRNFLKHQIQLQRSSKRVKKPSKIFLSKK